MKDPNAGKYQRIFREEFEMAERVLRQFGGTLKWSSNDYEAFRYTNQDVGLLFYPHTNKNTRNRSIRVREQASQNKAKAAELMVRLRIGAGFCNAFKQNNTHTWLAETLLCQRENLTMGRAREKEAA